MNDSEKIILPEGTLDEMQDAEAPTTERTKEREQEEQHFQQVIIKRSDLTKRHPDDTLEKAIQEGNEQLNRPLISLLLSSLAAGMIVGFSAMSVAVVSVITIDIQNNMLSRLFTACVYPIGFVICVLSGAQLFTEHTATAIYPVLDKKNTIQNLLRLWLTIICGNLIGAFVISALLWSGESVIQAEAGWILIGHHLVHFGIQELLISALLAGWLMALGAWLVLALPPGSSQIMAIFIVTFVIGLGGLHHSIAGSAEMFTAKLVSDEFSWTQVVRYISTALVGNLIGGSIFVGVLNYAHIRKTQPAE